LVVATIAAVYSEFNTGAWLIGFGGLDQSPSSILGTASCILTFHISSTSFQCTEEAVRALFELCNMSCLVLSFPNAAGAVKWDENVIAQHNRLLPNDGKELSSGKRSLENGCIMRDRKKAQKDMLPFRVRIVPYDIWRKHYTEDKDGNYIGTHSPAGGLSSEARRYREVECGGAGDMRGYVHTWKESVAGVRRYEGS
jgi:hypothetical protein